MSDPKEQIDQVEDVIQHGLNFCEAAMSSKDFELHANAVRESWDAIKQRLGGIYLITTFRHLDGDAVRHIEVQLEVERGVFVSVIDEVQENYISHIVEPLGIQRAIEKASR